MAEFMERFGMPVKILISLSFWALLGCLPEEGSLNSQSKTSPVNDFDDNSQIQPLFLCPPDEAVVGVSEQGKTLCAYAGIDGFPAIYEPKTESLDAFRCPDSFEDQLLHFDGNGANEANWISCRYKSPYNVVHFGAPHLRPFHCPQGTSFIGLDEAGRPLCQSQWVLPSEKVALAPEWDGVWNTNNFTCPFGFTPAIQKYSVSSVEKQKKKGYINAKIIVCREDSAAYEIALSKDVPVYTLESQRANICPGGQAVIGFDQDLQVICSKALSQSHTLFQYFLADEKVSTSTSCPNEYQPVSQFFRDGSKSSSHWIICGK